MKKQFRQNSIRRQINKRILILCEGAETEPIYFNALKSDKANTNNLAALRIIVHDSKKNTAKELVAEALELKKEAILEKNAYDAIWVVVDRDDYTKHPESFNRAEKTKICIGFSSPSFEYWFLMHFGFSSAPFENADAVKKKLKVKEHLPEYEKNIDVYQKLKCRQNAAIENSKKIIEHHANSSDVPIWKLNPYTNVGALVEFLLNL